jgi:hypothetical protein
MMDKTTENNLIALMEECLVNGGHGKESLWAWFTEERYLIETTLDDIPDEDRGTMVIK